MNDIVLEIEDESTFKPCKRLCMDLEICIISETLQSTISLNLLAWTMSTASDSGIFEGLPVTTVTGSENLRAAFGLYGSWCRMLRWSRTKRDRFALVKITDSVFYLEIVAESKFRKCQK